MGDTKAFWKSRGFWGPVFAFLAFVSQQAGAGEIDSGKAVEFVLYVVEVVGIVIAWVGRVRASARLGFKDAPAPVAPVGGAETVARLQAAWPATLAAILMATLLAACAADPEVRWAQGQKTYNATMDTLVGYRAPCVDTARYPTAGPDNPFCRIDDAAYRQIEVVRARIDRLLTKALAAIDLGNEAGAAFYLDELDAALLDLAVIQANAETEKKP